MSGTSIFVEHVTRVEGHGNIVLDAKDGRVLDVKWQVPEAPRLFEAMVVGRPYHQLARVTSRICGICSIGHTLASLKATEAAFGLEVSERTLLYRRLALHAENLQSHILHIGYLVAPDLFGADSVVPLVSSHRDAVLAVIRLHGTANAMSDLVCGRTTHPTNLVLGGLHRTPALSELEALRRRLEDSWPVCDAVGELLAANMRALPDFTRETEFIALVADAGYAMLDGDIGSTDTGRHAVEDYESITNEYVAPGSTAKYARHSRGSYMVGALARFNLNADRLSPGAKAWADRLGLKPVCSNPFMNNAAQFVEFVHSMEDSIALLDGLLEEGGGGEKPLKVVPREGRGIGAVEVPRGILFHDYTYDGEGRCVAANCVIPTNQNHGNIQRDMEEFAPRLLGRPDKEIELGLEMLVRAYDPCISCSTHYLDVTWKR